MTFECRRCGERWNEEGYTTDGTFFTLCEECAQEVLDEWALGKVKVDLQDTKTRNRRFGKK